LLTIYLLTLKNLLKEVARCNKCESAMTKLKTEWMHKVQDSRTHNKLYQTLSKLCQNPKKGEEAAYFFPTKNQQ
jgi:uncharacterized protein with PIN domain